MNINNIKNDVDGCVVWACTCVRAKRYRRGPKGCQKLNARRRGTTKPLNISRKNVGEICSISHLRALHDDDKWTQLIKRNSTSNSLSLWTTAKGWHLHVVHAHVKNERFYSLGRSRALFDTFSSGIFHALLLCSCKKWIMQCRRMCDNRLSPTVNMSGAEKRHLSIKEHLTCNIKACGVCTKYDTLPFGADCKQSWPSVATGLYMNTIAFDSLPSYSTYNREIWAPDEAQEIRTKNTQ